MGGLDVTSFDNGVIEWKNVSAAYAFAIKIRCAGKTVNTTVTSPRFDTNAAGYKGKELRVTVSAIGQGCEELCFCVKVNAAHTKLSFAGVPGVRYTDGMLEWKGAEGARYLVKDIEYNVIRVNGPRFDMTRFKPALGIAPSVTLPFADVERDDFEPITYLGGNGTAAEPYLITTPFDLRAIDYYETVYAARAKTDPLTPRNHYLITRDLNFNRVNATEDESNIHQLCAPFYGELDGGGKKLYGVRVKFASGCWALFDHIAPGGVVKDVYFDSPFIVNRIKHNCLPINASVALVANVNHGHICGIKVSDARFFAMGGEVGGIALHNFGTVSGCLFSGKIGEIDTGQDMQACYEMAGIVLENYGAVERNFVESLEIVGSSSTKTEYEYRDGAPVTDMYGHRAISSVFRYNNVRTAAGIVSVNRSGGIVCGNGYTAIRMTNMLDSYGGQSGYGYEFGGIAAYNAGTVIQGGDGLLGALFWGGQGGTVLILQLDGNEFDRRCRRVSKNDGVCVDSDTV